MGQHVVTIGLVIMVAACTTTASIPEPQPSSLIRTTEEAAGTNCADGGVAIETGLDLNGNALLDADEVTETVYICTNDPEPNQLVRVDMEPAGANCLGGGAAVHVGADLDNSGVLDDTEITATSYVCGEIAANPTIIYGNVDVQNNVDAAQLVGVQEVTGSINVDAPDLTAINLASLVRVGGDLTVQGTALTVLNLPNLEVVGEDLTLVQPATYVAFSAPKLTTVRDVNLLSVTSVSLALLATCRVLDIRGTGAFALPVTRVDSLRLAGPAASSAMFSFTALTEVGSNDYAGISVSDNVSQLSFPLLAKVTGDVSFGFTPIQTNSGFPLLAEITESIDMVGNDALVSLGFPALTQLTTLQMTNNPLLPTCQITALATQAGGAQVIQAGNNDAGTCP